MAKSNRTDARAEGLTAPPAIAVDRVHKSFDGDKILHDVARETQPATWQPFTERVVSTVHSYTMMDVARDRLTIRQVARDLGTSQGHRVLYGSAKTIADSMEEWLLAGACDGG